MTKITNETRLNLFINSGKAICDLENDTDRYVSKLQKLDKELDCELVNIKRLAYKTKMMLNFINLDLCAAFRQYLSTNTNTNYEKRQAMTKINIVMSEGFKKIYGFGESQQKKSFWVSQIKIAIDSLGSYADEYNRIEVLLKDMANDHVLNKEMRDLAIHYDDDPLKVYKMLSDLSAEEVTSRCNRFFGILAEVTKFVWALINHMTSSLALDK